MKKRSLKLKSIVLLAMLAVYVGMLFMPLAELSLATVEKPVGEQHQGKSAIDVESFDVHDTGKHYESQNCLLARKVILSREEISRSQENDQALAFFIARRADITVVTWDEHQYVGKILEGSLKAEDFRYLLSQIQTVGMQELKISLLIKQEWLKKAGVVCNANEWELVLPIVVDGELPSVSTPETTPTTTQKPSATTTTQRPSKTTAPTTTTSSRPTAVMPTSVEKTTHTKMTTASPAAPGNTTTTTQQPTTVAPTTTTSQEPTTSSQYVAQYDPTANLPPSIGSQGDSDNSQSERQRKKMLVHMGITAVSLLLIGGLSVSLGSNISTIRYFTRKK